MATTITPQQHAILTAYTGGHDVPAIARAYGLGEDTVRDVVIHTADINRKTAARILRTAQVSAGPVPEQVAPFEPVKVVSEPNALTASELDALRLMCLGLSNADIGVQLYLSEDTIKSRLRKAYRKLGVTGRIPALIASHRLGLFAGEGAAAQLECHWCAPCGYIGDAEGHPCPTVPVRVHVYPTAGAQ